jgi:very-short-patch-repair endonuclease
MTDPTQPEVAEAPDSIFQSNLPLSAKLERARLELLDMSARNRLLNIPRSGKSVATLEIVDEHTRQIFRLLVQENRTFSFLPGRAAPGAEPSDSDEIADLAQPENDEVDSQGLASRHTDTKLQTRLTPAGLQKRLLNMYHDARTLEEEQGVNILFLALGTLKWIDPNNAEKLRYAPLILVPVMLERGNAAEKFKLKWRQEDVASNLSLEAFLDKVHQLKMPVFDAGDEFDPDAYMRAVSEAVAGKAGWAVDADDIVLGFFSFAKFLMYRDLDPNNWPTGAKLSEHELIKSLVSDGFSSDLSPIGEDEAIDQHITPSQMTHIVDSDSSQTVAIHEVRSGRNIVIQGPPGTGKSQTIANIIASAVADQKTVLFVAEKMAALEVVKRRLDNTGVGDACLEIHSSKANKRAVLEELRRTWELGAPKGEQPGSLNSRLSEALQGLNSHAERLHEPLGTAEFTPYQVIGHLTRLRQKGQEPTNVTLVSAERWSAEDLSSRVELILELTERVSDIGIPASHLWRGIGLTTAFPMDVDRFVARIVALRHTLDEIHTYWRELSKAFEQAEPIALNGIEAQEALALRLAGAPDFDDKALGDEAWTTQTAAIGELLAAGGLHCSLVEELTPTFHGSAWGLDLPTILKVLDALPENLDISSFDRVLALVALAPRILEEAGNLAVVIGRAHVPKTLGDIKDLIHVAERVGGAPSADVKAFASDLWDEGVERAADLAIAVEALQKSRTEIGTGLTEVAWETDLGDARRILAGRGTDLFRFFSGEWRAANRFVRSFLTEVRISLDRQLALLDALGRGQAALKVIKLEDELGRSAFAGDWRGDRSSAEPLLALVEWMRSLKGVGSEPRVIASRGPDQKKIQLLNAQLTDQAAQMRVLLEALWRDFRDQRGTLFSKAGDPLGVILAEMQPKLEAIQEAHLAYVHAAKEIDPSLKRRRESLLQLVKGQGAAATISAQSRLGTAAFGTTWAGLSSDWPLLRRIAMWILSNLDIHQLAGRTQARKELPERFSQLLKMRNEFAVVVGALLADLKAGPGCAVTSDNLLTLPISDLKGCLDSWIDKSELLSKWVDYQSRAQKADALGMSEIVSRLHTGQLATETALPCFEMSYFEKIFAEQARVIPELASFDGELHGRVVRGFADLDIQRIKQAAFEVVSAHYRGIPSAAGGALGPLGVLKSEIARKRGHMPIRQLIQKAAPAVRALKPVFMMSPLSVAQFLPPGALSFDLLVMDEASQIQPVDALGAIARCKQVVVVGDPQQLPPTAFFTKMTAGGDGADTDEGAAHVGDIESILGLFTARGLPMRMLRWHYRSRHESLIAVSNRQFYENKLYIVPSPYTAKSGLGLRFHHVADGLFETGATRTNPIEAKVVAQAIIRHAIETPNQTLGVVAFSVAQRRAIQDQLEMLRRALPPKHEAFFQAHGGEPFFIKNLENVQGDERDVIFISVGYGPTAPGTRPPMRFGPVGIEGGERRLNVLISRAKRRCDVFSSMTDEDIDPDFASTRKGVFALKMFMHFARTGRMTMAEHTARDHSDVFEEQVAQALHARGYQVNRQVGIAGIFIDLAIVDPEHPDRFVLGIECDGGAYASARSARDRDRLRKAVLEDHGWSIYRIWSIDWFRRPKEQLERLIGAIEAAKAELTNKDSQTPTISNTLEIVSVERGDVTEMALVATDVSAAAAYTEANISPPTQDCELHQTPVGMLAVIAEQVVAVEGPIFIEEIVNRIRDAWGLKRAGTRIQDAVERAVDLCVRQHRLSKEGWFYSIPGREPIVRDRSGTKSATLRKPEALPPAEIQAALVSIISSNFGATEDQAVMAVSRVFGFKATSSQLREVIIKIMEELIGKEILARKDGLIDLGPHSPPRGPRPVEPVPLDRLIAEGEHEKLEFKETLRWDIHQNAINKKLEEVAVKTVAAFANHSGGTLLIGVDDNGLAKGLAGDFGSLNGNQDAMELHLTNLINGHFTPVFRARKVKVSFPFLNNKMICRVDVERSRTPVYVKVSDRNGTLAERLFVRLGNSSHEIPASQIAEFVNEHFD